MTMTPVRETHIYLDDKGRAYVKPAGVKVRMIIESLAAYQCPPEELVKHFPHLTVSEVFAALAYYHDHRAAMDAEIQNLKKFADNLQKATPESPATKRVREAMKHR
jgi:uncharacterized protein (DUF433 family)